MNNNVNKYKDFDQFYAESKRQHPTLKIFGQVYQLPVALPALLMVRTIRLQKEHGDMASVPPEQLLEMATALFGDRFDELLEKGLDVEQMGDLISWAMEQYVGGDRQETGGEGNAKPQVQA